jgi:hypothetical protein
MRICVKCGHENADDADFCASCGNYIRWEPTGVHEQLKPPETPRVDEPPPEASPPVDPSPTETKRYSQVGEGGAAPVAPQASQDVVLALRLPGEEGAGQGAPTVEAAPGGQATLLALVRNSSGIVDNYDVRVVGLPDSWWTATPATVYLVPFGSPAGEYEQEVEIRLHPPVASESEARPWPVRVAVTSRAHGTEVASASATLQVGAFQALEAEMRPERAGGRRKADFAIAVRNRANAPAQVSFSGVDPDGTLSFDFQQPQVVANPGHRAGTAFRVRPPKQIILGKTAERRFEVLAQASGPEEFVLRQPGVFRQKAWLPLWLLVVVPLLIALAVVLWLLLFHNRTDVPDLLGKTVEQAREAVQDKDLKLVRGPSEEEDKTNDPAKIGTIKFQDPEPGETVEKKSEVTVVLWVGTGEVRVPNLVDRTLEQADAVLRRRGLSWVADETPDDPATAVVKTQLPAAGSRVAEGDVVTLTFVEEEKSEGGGAPVPPVTPTPPDTSPGPEEEVTLDLVFDDGANLFRIGRSSEEPQQLTEDPGLVEQPAWNPRRNQIAFRQGTDENDAQIWVMNPNRPKSARAVTNEGFTDNRPAFSPNGQVIAFTRGTSQGGDHDLCFVRVSGEEPSSCIEEPDRVVSRPVWTPGGRSILVRAEDDEQQVEYLEYVSAVANSPNPSDWVARGFVTQDLHDDTAGEAVHFAAWSPDGTQLAISANWGTDFAYLVLASATVGDEGQVTLEEPEPLTDVAACELAWLPGGTELAVAKSGGQCEERGEIVRLDPAESEDDTRVVPNGSNPAPRPQGG